MNQPIVLVVVGAVVTVLLSISAAFFSWMARQLVEIKSHVSGLVAAMHEHRRDLDDHETRIRTLEHDP